MRVLFLVVWLLHYCCAASTCTIASCDDFMRDLAFSFSCDSRLSCLDQIASHLSLIVPSDSETAYDSMNNVWEGLIASSLCVNKTACEESLDARAKLDQWARIPTSSLIAFEKQARVSDRYTYLKQSACAWNTTTEGVDPNCELWFALNAIEAEVAARRVLYSLRRERRYITVMLKASCELLQGWSESPCGAVIEDLLTQIDASITNSSTRFLLNPKILVDHTILGDWFVEASFLRLNQRSCDGDSPEGPCLRDIYGPILALDGSADVTTFRIAMEKAQSSLVSANENIRAFGVSGSIAIGKVSLQSHSCGFRRVGQVAVLDQEHSFSFHATPWTLFLSHMALKNICPAETFELQRRFFTAGSGFPALNMTSWLTNADLEAVKDAAHNCLVNCLPIYNVVLTLDRYWRAINKARNVALPMLFEALCDSPNCVAASRLIAVVNQDSDLRGLTFEFMNGPDKIYYIFGLLGNSLFIVAFAAVLVMAIFVWKVFALTQFYVWSAGLMILLCTVDLIGWSIEAATSYENGMSLPYLPYFAVLFRGLADSIELIILLFLLKNWAAAGLFVIVGYQISRAAEKGVFIVSSIAAGCLILVSFSFGVAFILAERSFWSTTISASRAPTAEFVAAQNRTTFILGYAVSQLVVHVLLLSICAVLVLVSTLSIWVLKRRLMFKNEMRGLVSFNVLAVVLLIFIAVRATYFFMIFAEWSVPSWFYFGFIGIAIRFCNVATYFVLLVWAIYGAHSKTATTQDTLSTELLSAAASSSVPLVYDL